MTGQTWTADNGNGTFTNPLFYEEFSDPDIIRVGDTFWMTGTTMHTMPGLPILRSADLVNWELVSYVFDVLDLGPSFRLEGTDIYGQGIWAPCLRYRDGVFYIFSNINKHNTQIFTATDPAGPWARREMKHSLHDLSVLFDDDGKAYVVWGYRNLQLAQLTDDLTDLVPGTLTEIFDKDAQIGEGVHFYKVDGQYILTSAWFAGSMRMAGARADAVFGPWELNPSLSEWEDFGLREGYRLEGGGLPFTATPPFKFIPPNSAPNGRMSLHQGGIVDTPSGEWWGWSMMDYNSIGRLTCLSPVTWSDGWPYFGLKGNLGRTPRTWVKPSVGVDVAPHAPFQRDDGFDSGTLNPLWQWNHVPVPEQWSLGERKGHLRLHALPAASFWGARNTLTQRAVGPVSTITVKLDAHGLSSGDVAGLGLLGLPYRWLGVRCLETGLCLELHDQQGSGVVQRGDAPPVLWLRVQCDFLAETANFSWSADGEHFDPIGGQFTMAFQLKTFQGMRYGLFAYNEAGQLGGYADFDDVAVTEPHPRGLMRPIPQDATIAIYPSMDGRFADQPCWSGRVQLGSLGRVALVDERGFLRVAADGSVDHSTQADPGEDARFQWMETPYGDLLLMSLATHRFLRWNATLGFVADSAGPSPAADDGVRFKWTLSAQ